MFELLHNQIDITQVPFSDRGSRLLVYKENGKSQLYIKLAERLNKVDPSLEAHVNRPPLICGLSLLGPGGDILDFKIDTTPAFLVLSTTIGKYELAFQNESTLAFGFPKTSISGIKFKVQNEGYRVADANGALQPIRIVSYSTNGTIIKENTTLTQYGYDVQVLVHCHQDSALIFHISDKKYQGAEIPAFSEIRNAAQKRWENWFDLAPPVAEKYRKKYAYAWWVMANNLISPLGNIGYEAMMPSKAKYIGLWLWDSALHALAFRHISPEVARNQIRVFIANQLPDGMLPDVVYDEGIVSEIGHPIQARVTKPPILAWAALKIHQSEPDLDFLEEIYQPLVRWNAWWFHQSTDGMKGLAQYNHPYSSGLDDNPLWDDGMPVVSPDLNTYLYIQMMVLSQIAQELGLEAESVEWARRSNAIVEKMIIELWDERAGLFRAFQDKKPIAVITPFNLYPLWTGILPEIMRDRILEHLKNPDEFWGKVMLPSVGRNDNKYDPKTMWRGPVWANINYFFIEALSLAGADTLATELRDITLNLIMDTDGIYEYYHAETGQPPITAAAMFGWTAAVFIDLAIQASAVAK